KLFRMTVSGKKKVEQIRATGAGLRQFSGRAALPLQAAAPATRGVPQDGREDRRAARLGLERHRAVSREAGLNPALSLREGEKTLGGGSDGAGRAMVFE